MFSKIKRQSTDKMTTREIGLYREKMANHGWPGSKSIHPVNSSKVIKELKRRGQLR